MRQQCRGMELEKKPCEPRWFQTWNFYQFCVLINFHDNRNNNVGKCREFSPPKLPLIELCSLEFAGNFGAHLRDFHLPQGSGHSQLHWQQLVGKLGELARGFLSIPAANADVECLFSVSGRILKWLTSHEASQKWLTRRSLGFAGTRVFLRISNFSFLFWLNGLAEVLRLPRRTPKFRDRNTDKQTIRFL